MDKLMLEILLDPLLSNAERQTLLAALAKAKAAPKAK
jgi:hypothetical protein